MRSAIKKFEAAVAEGAENSEELCWRQQLNLSIQQLLKT